MLTPENSILVVIDIQESLAQVMYEKNVLFDNLQKIIKGAKILDIPMIVTEQVPEKLGVTIPEITSLLDDVRPIPKASFSCCGEDRFMKELDGIQREQIIVVGIESHVCVYQTTSDLIRMGYDVQIVTDCISSRTSANRTLGIKRMKNEGAKLTGTEMALFELMKIAGGDRFREISRLVK
ncbi:MAG TPA: hydrolase [Syntrophales bacterium]|nr:hydrolase [Syntrophales bacterium]HPQ44333.1 hydrolase [Syntrophales bacterium]